MSNPRIEEVSDEDEIPSDPEEMDPSAFDFARPQGSLQQFPSSSAAAAAASQISPETLQAMLQPQTQQSNRTASNPAAAQAAHAARLEQAKRYQCFYPVYFDRSRTRAQGRRVSKKEAVDNPLARDILDALNAIGQKLNVPLDLAMEPSKTHPKDWANPGRVRVQIKKEGEVLYEMLPNKHALYKLIAIFLQANPTTEQSPFKLQLRGLPPPKDNKFVPPAVPRGFKINSILPLHSPALSGGGVSDNLFRDMMAEMGGAGGLGEAPSQGQKKVKDKDKKKKG